jgi:hypothetical protein
MTSAQAYTLEIVCPHCHRITAISDWPASCREPTAFTCTTKHGGCGGHALIEPPDVTGFPNLAVLIVTPAPLTEQVYAFATDADMPAWMTTGRTAEIVCARCGRRQLTGSVPPGRRPYIAFICNPDRGGCGTPGVLTVSDPEAQHLVGESIVITEAQYQRIARVAARLDQP